MIPKLTTLSLFGVLLISLIAILMLQSYENYVEEEKNEIANQEEEDLIKLIKQEPPYLCHEKDTEYHQKILSYTLFGNGTRMSIGKGVKYRDYIRKVLQQARASELYQNWKVRIYHDSMLDPEILRDNEHNDQVQFCNVEKLTFYNLHDFSKVSGKFWRNIPIGDKRVAAVCFRDLDSPLLKREEFAVDDWLKSNKMVHTMRDHPQHLIGMLAGMWCFRSEINRTLSRLLLEEILDRALTYHHVYYDHAYDDQPLLHKVVWEKLYDNSVQHDSYTCKHFPGSKPFPKPREDDSIFVGCPTQPCQAHMPECPIECRPSDHPEWTIC